MNFLAHLVLSDHTPESMVGNTMADFIRGREAMKPLPPRVRLGVRVHRAMDRYCDEHAEVKACAALLKPKWGRYSGIIIDIYFDHILSTEWENLDVGPLSLRDFADRAYEAFAAHRDIMPERMQRVTAGMTKSDSLVRSSSMAGIEDALERVSRRLSRPVPLADSVEDLVEHRALLEEHFRTYWPAARRQAVVERERFLSAPDPFIS